MVTEKKWLYLDDVRIPDDRKWNVVRSYNEFTKAIDLLGLDSFSVISLDHDLGMQSMIEYYTNVKKNYTLDYDNLKGEKTGYDCAKYLVAHSIRTGIPLPYIYVHSANPIGAANIIGYINNYLKNCGLKPSCVAVQIAHKIDEKHILTPEQRTALWDKHKK